MPGNIDNQPNPPPEVPTLSEWIKRGVELTVRHEENRQAVLREHKRRWLILTQKECWEWGKFLVEFAPKESSTTSRLPELLRKIRAESDHSERVPNDQNARKYRVAALTFPTDEQRKRINYGIETAVSLASLAKGEREAVIAKALDKSVTGAITDLIKNEIRSVHLAREQPVKSDITAKIRGEEPEPEPKPEPKPKSNVVSITKARAKKVPVPEPEVDPDDAVAVAEALPEPKKAKAKKAKKQSALDRVIYRRVPRKKENKREAHVRWIDEGLMDVIRPIAQVQLDLESNVEKITYITPEEAAKLDNLIGQIQNAAKAIKKYRKSITIKE